MNFLVWYNPFTWVTDLIANAWGIIWSGLDILLYKIATWVYNILINLIDLFDILTKVRLLDNEIIKTLAERIGIILGIVMLFLVVLSAIKLMLDPDKINDKEQGMGNIVKKIVMVIVMIGLSTSVFNALYGIQKLVIESNIIGKILLPNEVDTENFGPVLASELFTSFYRINDVFLDEDGKLISDAPEEVEDCYKDRNALRATIARRNGYNRGLECLNKTTETDDEEIEIIEFNPILLVGCGLFAAYFIFGYCISVGVRVIQLAFLEIISPMAIISYLSPKKDTMFEKWSKLYISTYIDVFIRIMIISFAVFLIATIFDSNIFNNTSNNTLLKMVMILAILTFAKNAPDLLKDLFPSSGSKIGLFPKNGFAKALGIGAAGVGLGAIAGAAGGAVAGNKMAGKLGGALSGMVRGGLNGLSSRKPQDLLKSTSTGFGKAHAATMLNEQRIAAGGSRNPLARIGSQARVNRLDKKKADLEAQNKLAKSISDQVSNIKNRAISQFDKGKFNSENVTLRNVAKQKLAAIDKQAEQLSINDFMKSKESYMKNGEFDSEAYSNDLSNAQEQFDTAQRELANKRLEVQKEYNEYEKAAISDFVAAGNDPVLENSINEINSSLSTNQTDAKFDGDTSDWESLDKLDGSANKLISQNNTEIQKNEAEGKADRANVKYKNSK